MKLFELLV
jgi:hypothetical protein